MSRKGKQPIVIPKGVECKIENNLLHVKGPKGQLSFTLPEAVEVKIEGSVMEIFLTEQYKDASNYHGLYRVLINNMVIGVSQGYEYRLEMVGVGYRAAVQGNLLDLQIGLSHPTKMEIPQGVAVKIEKNNIIILNGIDKQLLGQFAASIRAKRPPEPFQGKGIRYANERVRRKAGKAAGKK